MGYMAGPALTAGAAAPAQPPGEQRVRDPDDGRPEHDHGGPHQACLPPLEPGVAEPEHHHDHLPRGPCPANPLVPACARTGSRSSDLRPVPPPPRGGHGNRLADSRKRLPFGNKPHYGPSRGRALPPVSITRAFLARSGMIAKSFRTYRANYLLQKKCFRDCGARRGYRRLRTVRAEYLPYLAHRVEHDHQGSEGIRPPDTRRGIERLVRIGA
jgi:hypothetical protein